MCYMADPPMFQAFPVYIHSQFHTISQKHQIQASQTPVQEVLNKDQPTQTLRFVEDAFCCLELLSRAGY